MNKKCQMEFSWNVAEISKYTNKGKSHDPHRTHHRTPTAHRVCKASSLTIISELSRSLGENAKASEKPKCTQFKCHVKGRVDTKTKKIEKIEKVEKCNENCDMERK